MTFDPRILAVVLAGFALLLAVLGIRAGARRRPVSAFFGVLLSLALLGAAALFGALAISVQGYRALTREEVAATIEIQPVAEQRFVAHVTLADGSRRSYQLAGDQVYVDARVLKWHPLANLLGLHTQYALDRISGRYFDIDDERHAPRTIFTLVQDAPLDAFVLRREHDLLAPLVDASYGSGTFTEADRRAVIEVRVSTSGLLLRERERSGRRSAQSRSKA